MKVQQSLSEFLIEKEKFQKKILIKTGNIVIFFHARSLNLLWSKKIFPAWVHARYKMFMQARLGLCFFWSEGETLTIDLPGEQKTFFKKCIISTKNSIYGYHLRN